jgi:hypothetical protein
MNRTVALILSLLVAVLTVSTEAFVAPRPNGLQTGATTSMPLNAFGKKPKQDFSDIETRDMTREEMIALNAKNEEIMNMELGMMTGVSLLFSLPILYLCWVAFFSD